MKRLDLKIGFACNNHCDFCAQGAKRRVLERRPLGELARELEAAARGGVEGVVFTGGEPTLHPGLASAVALAKAAGFKSIQIQTNGRMFSYRKYCEQLRDAGADEFSPSLHGSSPAIHDGLTRAPGSWKQVVAGIRNLKSLGLHVLTNTVVTARNFRDLPALARLLAHLGVDQFQFAFVHIVGAAADNAAAVVPRKSEAVPFMLEGLRAGAAAGVPGYTEAVPYCLLRGFEDRAAERAMPDGPVIDLEVRLESWRDYRVGEGKAKGPRCRDCRHDSVCEGPWREYPLLYGWDEFVPVPKEP